MQAVADVAVRLLRATEGVRTSTRARSASYGLHHSTSMCGVDGLRMFNVSRSPTSVKGPQVKAAAANGQGLEREAVFGQYEVWRVEEQQTDATQSRSRWRPRSS